MRVLINDLSTLSARTGVGHYTTELVRALRAAAGADAVRCFPSGLLRRVAGVLVRGPSRPGAGGAAPGPLARLRGLVAGGCRSFARRVVGRSARVAFWLAARRGCDLYHEPNFLPRPCDLPTVVTIHDLSVLLHPEWHPPERLADYAKRFELGLRQARHLVAVSEFTRREIVRHLGWRPEGVTVTHNGRRADLRPVPPDEAAPVLRGFGLAPGYLLHVGTLEPRKNILMLLRAYCSLPAERREAHPLVLAGGYGWDSGEIVSFLEAEGRHRNVRWLGYVPDAAFPALYSAARALVFPTHYEGFGLPAIEMMACGGAVLGSTAGAVAEVTGGRAHLLDPHDADGWRSAMLRVCRDDDWHRELRRGVVEASRPFTWERCAAQTLGAYRVALDGGAVARAA